MGHPYCHHCAGVAMAAAVGDSSGEVMAVQCWWWLVVAVVLVVW